MSNFLSQLNDAQVKQIKTWGTIDGDPGSSVFGHWQKPSEWWLKHHDPERQYQLGGESVTFTYKGGMDLVSEILSHYPAEPETLTGAKGVSVTLSGRGQPVFDIQVVEQSILMCPRGSTPKEEADFGSDGEGNTDYDNWTMQRNKQLTHHSFQLKWDKTLNWLPFSLYGKQLIDPWTLAAYQKLVKGGCLEGDVYTCYINGNEETWPLNMFVQITDHSDVDGWNISDINPVSRSSVAYKKLWEEKVLILIHTWSEQWVISKSYAKKHEDKEIPLTNEQKSKYKSDIDKGKIVVSTSVKGNQDGPEKDGEKTDRTFTVTRSFTTKELWTPGLKAKIPVGYMLKEPERDPNP